MDCTAWPGPLASSADRVSGSKAGLTGTRPIEADAVWAHYLAETHTVPRHERGAISICKQSFCGDSLSVVREHVFALLTSEYISASMTIDSDKRLESGEAILRTSLQLFAILLQPSEVKSQTPLLTRNIGAKDPII